MTSRSSYRIPRAALPSSRRRWPARTSTSRACAPSSTAGARDDGQDLTLEQIEKRHIERVLQQEHGKVVRAAEKLGVPKSSLYYKIKKHGIPLPKG